MREGDIIAQVVSTVTNNFPNAEVLTHGGDNEITPPEIVIRWNRNRLPYHAGHRIEAGAVTDGSGNKVGKEFHSYNQMDLTFIVHYYAEADRDQSLTTLDAVFLPYEDEPSNFDDDTFDWKVEGSNPRPQNMMEPDWYEVEYRVRFKYITRADDSGRDIIETIPTSVNGDDTIINITTTLK